ncbi:multidrug resistance protein fnx1-like protein [Ascodesmis nigricans]|uniref:Multidrug resistance protein fnx1-like protein n=1 Tax=Ascodesmis nigricans TaxID=341454 RepID=A0A4S2MSR8_9PEZI|nr:multidrug resistance protein fnx1-like protein [Ascodesmis nigricans]
MSSPLPGRRHDDTAKSSERTNENTSLLVTSPSADSSSSNGKRPSESSDASSITTVEERDELQSFLSRANSNVTPLGPEAEVLPNISTVEDDPKYWLLNNEEYLNGKDADEEDPLLPHTVVTRVSGPRFWIIFASVILGNFVGAFDSTIMSSTHTSITSAFHSSELASWLSTSFLLTSTSFQPLFGRLSDVLGRRVPFVTSALIFTLATVWCALAQSFWSFTAARAVCGLGAGGMLIMGSIVLSDLIPIEIRAGYQSLNNLAFGAGSVLGAGLGGFLADTFGWRWEFGLQVPFGIFVMIVGACVIPPFPTHYSIEKMTLWERFADFDWAGSFFLVTSVGTLILAMSLGGNLFPWSDPRVLTPLILSIILALLLYRAEKSATAPVLPPDLIFRNPQGNLIFAGFFTMLTVNSIIFNLPLYFQSVLLESATKAGSRLLIPSIASTVGSTITGLLVTRLGKMSYTYYFGNGMVIAGAVVFCFLNKDARSWVYTVTLIPANMGLGAFLPSQLIAVLGLTWTEDHPVATSNAFMLRALGSVIGIASSGLILQNSLVRYLHQYVTGEGKEEVIKKVRSSVTAILQLDKVHQQQGELSAFSLPFFIRAWS